MPAATPIRFEERKQIEKFLKQGLSCGAIATLINRSKNGIVSEVRRLGRDNYTAQEAQSLADQAQLSKKNKLHVRNKGNQVNFKMKQRIENLEMQVEILFDAIKEFKKND